MDIKAGDDYLTLPEPCETRSVQLAIYPKGNPEKNPASYAVLIQQISFNEMVEMKAKLPPETKISGVPNYFAIALIEGKQRLFFWPTPDRDLFARFRYCPAMKEI